MSEPEDISGSDPLAITLRDQARLLDEVLSNTVLRGGEVARLSYVALTDVDVAKLTKLVDRLYIMAPYEGEIKDLVKWGGSSRRRTD